VFAIVCAAGVTLFYICEEEETVRENKEFNGIFWMTVMPLREASEDFCFFCVFHFSAILSIHVDLVFKRMCCLKEITRF